ncbi:hypothetical protein LX80_00579 [Hydrotalea sandarakina]|uniref:Uncharacterized protein n=1 Tax=Hydrotalea sandarakina TaxID=1004304 RepID=A0A2W7RUM5_9BACT|nr:hypothetical protein LX80_00579 [Hydrotalea sandarakina]
MYINIYAIFQCVDNIHPTIKFFLNQILNLFSLNLLAPSIENVYFSNING